MQQDQSEDFRSRRTSVGQFVQRLAFAALLICALTLAQQAAWFLQMVRGDHDNGAPLAAAIVFTGDHARTRAGLQLLRPGRTPRLFISGANPEAGVWLDRFTAEFGDGRADFRGLVACCVEFGARAQNTLQNGIESACWLERNQISGPIGLITSSAHMPRAFAALDAHLTNREIVPIKPKDEPPSWSLLASEFMQFIATKIILKAPRFFSEHLWGEFFSGCADNRAER